MLRVLRIAAIVAASLVAVLLVTMVGLSLIGARKLGSAREPADRVAGIATDSASIAHGEHLMRILSCQVCHGERLEGKVFVDIPPAMAVAANLTPGKGGVGSVYNGEDWDRAIRYGKAADGRVILPFMPTRLFNSLNDRDAAALASYLESLQPIDNELPRTRAKFPGKVIWAIRSPLPGKRSSDIPVLDPAESAEYGAYLASVTCIECHGTRLQGGEHPDPSAPPAVGLHHTAQWTREEFATALRTGRTPQRQLSEHMPWKSYQHMTDTELGALQAYLRTLAAPGT